MKLSRKLKKRRYGTRRQRWKSELARRRLTEAWRSVYTCIRIHALVPELRYVWSEESNTKGTP